MTRHFFYVFKEQNIKNVTDFLKMFGIKTNQESVAFVIDGEMYYIYFKELKHE